MKGIAIFVILMLISAHIGILRTAIKNAAQTLKMFLWKPTKHFWEFYEKVLILIAWSFIFAILLYLLKVFV